MARTVLILLGFYIPRGNFEVRAEIVPPPGVLRLHISARKRTQTLRSG